MCKVSKIAAFGLASVLVLTSLASCGGSKESGASSQSGEKKLRVGLTTSSMVTDYEDNYFTNYLEEKLGFELEFYMLPADAAETRTKVALMATSNEDLPDVLVVDGHLTNEMILEYGSNGFFMELDDITKDAARMPNYNAIPAEDRKLMDKAQTMADGHMYSLSAWEPETWNLTPNRMFINKAWLDKLGLQPPKTTDELKKVLIAMRDGDPNGNGIKDEIGVYGFSGGGYGENTTAALMNSFVFWNGGGVNGGLALDKDGKTVIAPFVSEEWRDGLRYMNDLYKEGVLSANIFTDDYQTFKALLNQDPQVVGVTTAGSLSNWPDVINNANYAEMLFIEPLKGPKGVQYTPYAEFTPTQELMILSSTDKLDMAVKFADQFFDHDTSIIERYGQEGVDWTREPSVLAEHSNAYIAEGLYDKLSLVITSTVWADNQKQTWRNHGPRYAGLEMGNTTYDFSAGKKFDPEDTSQLFGKNYKMYYDKHPQKVLPALKYTMDEAEQIQDQLTTIPDFVKQSLAEFVTGMRDVDKDWDSYLKMLDDMGLKQWIKNAQTAYDRN
ncbi:MAG: extracellular solute-binding protein [Schwartzia sp.]|nr:extracellular solute-binding protein [Schwartzia sp. (in: firmicutes)]